jgi:uncharacterized protein (TIGR03118 family)
MAKRGLALAASLALLVMAAVPVTARNINADNRYGVHIISSGPTPDGDLVNGWGIVASPTSPWWVADNGTQKSTLYNGNTGAKLGLVVTIPGHPTGIVFNGATSDFKVDSGGGLVFARFIFATDDGQIAGWNGAGPAISAATTPDAIYLGLAIGSSGGANYLYAANFPAARVDVFDATYHIQHLSGGDFVDPGLPAGYAPFGIQAIGNEIFIAFAKQDAAGDEELHGEGLGYVSAFGMDGSFHGRVASAGELNAPWGLAMAPSDFGKFSGDLLVGNFGDGRIHAFRPAASGWEEHGLIKGTDHRPISIDGLWGIGFGHGASTGSGPSNTLFFAAGPKDETEGLFGSITAP